MANDGGFPIPGKFHAAQSSIDYDFKPDPLDGPPTAGMICALLAHYFTSEGGWISEEFDKACREKGELLEKVKQLTEENQRLDELVRIAERFPHGISFSQYREVRRECTRLCADASQVVRKANAKMAKAEDMMRRASVIIDHQ